MRRCLVLVVALSGCFGDAAIGAPVTPHAPAPPSGDGIYARAGIGAGWANPWGMVQASGNIERIGHVSAAGGALRGIVFLDSWEREDAVGGFGIVARVFHGGGIGPSLATDELSLGFGGGFLGTHGEHGGMLESFDLSASAYTTTFVDRPPMRSYGVNLGLNLDVESYFTLACGMLLGIAPGAL